jgi:hypothetical protein
VAHFIHSRCAGKRPVRRWRARDHDHPGLAAGGDALRKQAHGFASGQEAIAAGEVFAAKLSFESGPFAGRIVALPNQMVTVGRAPDNDVVVGDPATSGRHGRIEVRAGSFWISDLGSTNGTLINGEPVIEKQLSDGDLITIGQNTIRFNLSE